ncbi:hypothetical protein, partial [Streptomyces afghaniensis]|uniref:hypothetical protein n=1 Tax=Streptomyces afghaniensis TaxID=66865 RepID=UPI002469B6E5
MRADEPPADGGRLDPLLPGGRSALCDPSPWHRSHALGVHQGHHAQSLSHPSLSPRSDIDLDEVDKVLRRLSTA